MAIVRRRRQAWKEAGERRRQRARSRRRRSIFSQLAAKVRGNVKPGRGLSNSLIRSFLSKTCGSDFKGVYSADRIPAARLAAQGGGFIIVVNLAKKMEADGHFVCIAASRARLLYLDPYGLSCSQKNVLSFLRRCSATREVKFNSRQLQRLESNYCGFYAILFALYLDESSPEKKRDFAIKFHTSNLRRNDKLCVGYIKRMLS